MKTSIFYQYISRTIVFSAYVVFFLATSHLSFAQHFNLYGKSDNLGIYPVGHQAVFTTDKSRNYDYSLGDSTVLIENVIGNRPIMLQIYYPASSTNGGVDMRIKNLYQFKGDAQTDFFLKQFEIYEKEMARGYAIQDNLKINEFKGDTSIYRDELEKLFNEYLSTPLYAKDNLQPLKQALPLIIYHQGLGGTFDENIYLLEFLAAHGFIVVSSSFVNSHSNYSLGVGDTEASINDIDYIVDYIKSKFQVSDKLYLMGHSFGANTTFVYPEKGKHTLTGMVPLDSDFGYSFSFSHMPDYLPDYSTQKNYQSTPILAAGRTEAHFRMFDLMDKTDRFFLNVKNFKHNDFCAQTILGYTYCLPWSKRKEEFELKINQYLNLCKLILNFLQQTQSNNSNLSLDNATNTSGLTLEKVNRGQRTAYNQPIEPGKGNCPNPSQLLSLMDTYGMGKALSEWTTCKLVKDTSYFDFTWFDIYETLIADSTTTRAIQFLNHYITQRKFNLRLRGFAYYTYESAFTDNGSGFHYYRGKEIFEWLMKNLPNDMEGYKGMVLIKTIEANEATEREKSIKEKELMDFCNSFIERFPNFYADPFDNDWDEVIHRLVKRNMDKLKK
jgi:hypothetical protein